MSYAKAFEGMMRMFPKRIKVTFVDEETGISIGMCKIDVRNLPEKFNRPVVIEAFGKKWRVLQAEPVNAEDFLWTKKLMLHVRHAFFDQPPDSGFLFPTMSADQPEMDAVCIFNDFVLNLPGENWRQVELLPLVLLPAIQEEMSAIENILFPRERRNLLRGYESMHLRKRIDLNSNNLSFEKFQGAISSTQSGAISLQTGSTFVKNGFAFKTPENIFYGIMQADAVRTLCLNSFECMNGELYQVLSTFGLVLADWCECRIVTGEVPGV